MAKIPDFDPFRASLFLPPAKSPPTRRSKDLKESAEDLHSFLSYGTNDPSQLQSSFLSLAILMHMADAYILPEYEEKGVIEAVREIKERLDGGSLKPADTAAQLDTIIRHINNENPKGKIVTMLVELEHYLCVSPPGGTPAIENSDFQSKTAPFFRLLQRDLTSIEATIVFKELEEVKKFIQKNPLSLNSAMESLQQKGEKLERRIL